MYPNQGGFGGGFGGGYNQNNYPYNNNMGNNLEWQGMQNIQQGGM
jgi:hypothetical protein